MKIKEFILLFVILFAGCKPDPIDFDAFAEPRIVFMVDSLLVDLNAAKVPEIVSVIQAEAGLTTVTQYVIKSEDSETMYENPITIFPNIHSFSVSKLIPYTEDVVGFKVEAKDRAGRIVSATLPIRVVPLRDAPVVTFRVNGVESTVVNYREGDPMPVIVINASSEDKLMAFAVSRVVNRVESPILIEGKDTIKFNAQEKSYQVDLSVDGYQFLPRTTAVKVYVSAGDQSKPKIKVATLKVEFVEIPGPEVVFAGGTSMSANEFTNITIAGNITADAKIKQVKFLRKKSTGNVLLNDVNLSPSQSTYPFSIQLDRVVMNDQGLIVEATDENNKTTTFTCTVNVVEVAPAPAVTVNQAVNDFNGYDLGQNIDLTGSIVTLSGFQSVDFVVYDNTGTIIQRSPISYSGNNISLNASFIATKATRKVGVEVVDVNDKITNVYRDVHVGYYYARVLMSMAGEDAKATSDTGPLPGPFFSAKNRKAMSYLEGKAAPMECDVAFHTQSSHGAVRVGNMTYARGSAKFTGHTKINAGMDTWGTSTNYTVKTISTINRADFDETTVDHLEGLTLTGSSETPVIASGAFPNPVAANMVVGYEAQIDGQAKKVVFIYDVFDNMPADKSASTFYIKVKIQK
ncbi:MAG: hypothetical protein Q7J05_01515 [Paludibacter sp.]|nr:hypothetical protein [Paludibacter sp.]